MRTGIRGYTLVGYRGASLAHVQMCKGSIYVPKKPPPNVEGAHQFKGILEGRPTADEDDGTQRGLLYVVNSWDIAKEYAQDTAFNALCSSENRHAEKKR